tara:strand:+ start:1591 stop:1797 length:207 start_codon:yes stop_codon:yes gene_type:complete
VKLGDLVKSIKSKDSIGIVVEIFNDLGEADPWIRVLFTHPVETYQWVKRNGLTLVTEGKPKKENPGSP